MNAANLSKSERLKRVAQLLKSGKAYSTLQIIRKAQVCAVNSIISELRANGMDINCRRAGDRWFYRMQ